MNKTQNPDHRVFVGSLFLIVLLSVLLSGCQTANYGKFRHSREVAKIFKSAQVLPDHQYYYTGSNTQPDAVMGIHKDFILDDDLWDKAKDIQKEIKYRVDQMNNNLLAAGYYILSPDGKQIGIYYSQWPTSPVQMDQNNKVIIYLPDKDAELRRSRTSDF